MANKSNSDGIYVVILVGGKGKRLRPLSTETKPKAFLSVTHDRKTMFRHTVDRALKITGKDKMLVVANNLHKRLVKNNFPAIRKENLLLEPVAKNTAPAIAFAASTLMARGIDPVIVVLPTDQYIVKIERYLTAIKRGVNFLKGRNDGIVVMGVLPSRPSTELGYIRFHDVGLRSKGVWKVEKFTEKPDQDTARSYIKNREYLWNTGAFIFKASTILKAFQHSAPKIYKIISYPAGIAKSYAKMPDISIDYAVMEKSHNIFCVKDSYEWQDMGSFDSLRKILDLESRKYVMERGKIIKII